MIVSFFFILQKVLEKNDADEHFPLLAICLGFELLTMIISKVIKAYGKIELVLLSLSEDT